MKTNGKRQRRAELKIEDERTVILCLGCSDTGTSESGFLKFEKWKVKIKSFHSFSRSAKWKKNAFTLFREVQSENKMLSLFFEKWKVKSKCFEIEIEKWKFSRILNHSRETRFFNRLVPWKPNKTAETDGLFVGY